MTDKNARKKRKLGSYPFVSVVFSITLAIFVMGLFGMLYIHAKSLTKAIQRNVEIQIYLDKQISQAEVDRLSRTISSMAFVRKDDEYPAMRFVSKEEAAKKFIEDTGEDFTEFIGDNPLRDALVVGVAPAWQTSDSLKVIKTNLEKSRGVFEVNYMESLVESINKNLAKLGLFLGGFTVLLLFVVVILINNTIKLALFSQRFLIRSMQLVGATATFIRRPFLLRAALYGLAGGLIASGLLYVAMTSANQYIENLADLQDMDAIMALMGGLVVLGALVGYLSTYYAIRKYLKISLDELY
jgi:cell division transport system permease protein